MSEVKTIVIPTDFSEASLVALSWAKQFAAMFDADLHCVYVLEEPHVFSTLDIGNVSMISLEELGNIAQSRLDDFVEEHFSGVTGTAVAKVLFGRPADEIAKYAESMDAAMIIMATHGFSGVKHVLLGSTAEAVQRQASSPVLSISSK
jgi:nucleotide-binding universal stress UspA family protein